MAFFDRFRKRKELPPSPSETIGITRDPNAFGGMYSGSGELNYKMQGPNKYRTYKEIKTNTTVIATGLRYFLELVAATSWTYQESDADSSGEYADMVKDLLHKRMETALDLVVANAAGYLHDGASLQEWTAIRYDDGKVGFSRISNRPLHSITRWIPDEDGNLAAVVQRIGSQEVEIPISKLLYLVDDLLDDSFEGTGLLRHAVEPARRLERLEQLEGYGFEVDVNGVPIARAPLKALRDWAGKDKDKLAEAGKAIDPLKPAFYDTADLLRILRQLRPPAKSSRFEQTIAGINKHQMPRHPRGKRAGLLRGNSSHGSHGLLDFPFCNTKPSLLQ
jgi:hypothetical protein